MPHLDDCVAVEQLLKELIQILTVLQSYRVKQKYGFTCTNLNERYSILLVFGGGCPVLGVKSNDTAGQQYCLGFCKFIVDFIDKMDIFLSDAVVDQLPTLLMLNIEYVFSVRERILRK